MNLYVSKTIFVLGFGPSARAQKHQGPWAPCPPWAPHTATQLKKGHAATQLKKGHTATQLKKGYTATQPKKGRAATQVCFNHDFKSTAVL